MITKINAIIFGLLALLNLSLSGDFWSQLMTFTWRSESVVMVSHSLRMGSAGNGPIGDVTFRTLLPPEHTFSHYLSQRYDTGDVQQQTSDFISSYAPGTTHTAFISPDFHRASVGHFPRSYALRFGLMGILFALLSTGLAFTWRMDFRSRRGNQAAHVIS